MERSRDESFRENIEFMRAIKEYQEEGQKMLFDLKKSESELEAFLIDKAQKFKIGFVNMKAAIDEMNKSIEHPIKLDN